MIERVKCVMKGNNEKVTLNIPTFEILLVIGIITLIVGILAPIQRIDLLGFTIWLDPNLAMILIPVGIGLICGYITRKILPTRKNGYVIGLVLGIIGIIVAVCMKPTNQENTNNNSSSKYEIIQRLLELKQNGTITDTEFEIEKSKILKGE